MYSYVISVILINQEVKYMNQEILAEIKSIMTYDTYKKYFLFSLFRRKSYKKHLVMFSVISFIGILAALFSIILSGFDIINTVLLLLLVFLDIFMAYTVIFAPKNYYNTAKKVLENTTIFRFTSEYLTVEATAEAASGNSTNRYEALHMIYEVNEAFYLYISSRQAYVVPKSHVNEEVLEQLRTIFRSKLGKKYRNYSDR